MDTVEETGLEELAIEEEVEEEVEVGVGVELEAGAGEAVEVGAEETTELESEGDLALESMPEGPPEAVPVKGLEIAAEEELGDALKDISAGIKGEELVAGPLELSEQAIEDVSTGLELDDSFEVSPVAEEAGPAPSEAEEPVEIAATEIEAETGVEEALRALEGEQDLNSELDALKADAEEPDMDTVEETGLEELAIEEEVEEVGAGAGEEEVLSALKEDLVSGGAPSESGTIQINDAEDAIKIAIQAEIVATKGHTKEAIRLFEALHLWEPERASYKERLDELRRI